MTALKPRLCHLKKVPDFAGYGFNLFARAGLASQFVGKVDPDSPAEKAGLRKDDRVVAVNGTNVETSTHAEVVAKIKERPMEVLMLVVDPDTDGHFKRLNVSITERLLNDDDEHEHKHEHGNHDHDNGHGHEHEHEREPHSEEPRPAADSRSSSESESEPVPEHEYSVAGAVAIAAARDSRASSRVSGHVEAHVSIVANLENVPPPPPSPPPEPAPKPRLCVMRKVPTFNGYGFNLLAKPGIGQVVGRVDANSPADTAGLRDNDRLIEVNGANVERDTHAQTVSRVKERPNEVTLLVVDAATDAYYKERDIRITVALLSNDHALEARGIVDHIESADDSSNQHSYIKRSKSLAAKPRLCVLVRVPTFNGYGFNLHSEKGRGGQYVGKIDSGSPAEAAGLREKDKLIEVNGSNVENETHAQVVTRIKERSNEVTMLVVDQIAEAYFRDRNIAITRELLNDAPPTYENGVAHAHAHNGSPKHVEHPPTIPEEPIITAPKIVTALNVEPARETKPVIVSSPQSNNKSDILSVTPAQVRERLQQNNPRVRVKQTDKSFKDKSAAFDML